MGTDSAGADEAGIASWLPSELRASANSPREGLVTRRGVVGAALSEEWISPLRFLGVDAGLLKIP